MGLNSGNRLLERCALKLKGRQFERTKNAAVGFNYSTSQLSRLCSDGWSKVSRPENAYKYPACLRNAAANASLPFLGLCLSESQRRRVW
jgi:hypothetical protein